jgi:hypothetical protein
MNFFRHPPPRARSRQEHQPGHVRARPHRPQSARSRRPRCRGIRDPDEGEDDTQPRRGHLLSAVRKEGPGMEL